jgi:hypothetical protein
VRHAAAIELEKMGWAPANNSEKALHRAALQAPASQP